MSADSFSAQARWVKFPLLFVLATCVLACGGTNVVRQAEMVLPDIEAPVWSKRYPSGLQVIAEQDTRTQAVAVVLVVGAGSAKDPSRKEGLAHYVEHLAFRSRPNGTTSFRALLEGAGAAEWNAFTNLDQTVYVEVGPKQALSSLLKLEGSRMTNPVMQVSSETYGVELDVVRNELRQRAETGYILEVLGAMQGVVFPPGHAYTRPVGGTHASLKKLTADDVAAFVKEHYRPENMTLQITGNVDFLELGKLITSSLPKELLEKSTTLAMPQTQTRRRIPNVLEPPGEMSTMIPQQEAAVATPEVWIGWSLPSQLRSNGYPPELLARILGGELSGLNAWDSDIAQTSVSVIRGNEATMLLCRLKLTRGLHPEKSVDHAFDVLEHIDTPREGQTAGSLTETDFVWHKQQAVVSLVLEAENLIRRGIVRATAAQSTGDPRRYSQMLPDLGMQDRVGTVEFIKTFINRKRARAVFFTPRTRQVESSLNLGFGTAEVDDEALIKDADAQTLSRIRAGIGAKTFEAATLTNGLQVIYAPRSGLRLITAHLRFFGNVEDSDDLGAAFGASLVASTPSGFFGAARSGEALFQRKFETAMISYSVTGFSSNMDTLMASLAQSTHRFSVRPNSWQTFQREKVPYFAAIEMRPNAVAERNFLESLFRGSKFGRQFTTAQLANTTAEQVERWLNETHAPNNAALVIVGEFDRANIDQLVQKHFGSWMTAARVFPPAKAINPDDKQASEPNLIVAHRPDATQAEIMFGCLLPPADQQATDVRHDLGAALLEDRLSNILRNQAGASYGIRVVALMRRGGTAHLKLEGVVDSSKLVYSLSTIKTALEDFAKTPVEHRDLVRTKLRLARKHSVRYMSNSSIAEAMGSFAAIGFPISTIDDYGTFVAQVTAEDIRSDFKACFAGRPTVAIVGNEPGVREAFKNVWQTPATPAESPPENRPDPSGK